jgi:hypothetical protein
LGMVALLGGGQQTPPPPPTHDAMPHFFGTSHRILFPLIFLI